MRELALHVMDIVQNSLSAGADKVLLELEEDLPRELLTIRISDNGKGMTGEQAQQAVHPFYTTGPKKAGLGLPLFREAARRTGGELFVGSEPQKGTSVTAVFHTASIDMAPLGDINGTVMLLIVCNPGIELVFSRKRRTAAGKETAFCLCEKTLPGLSRKTPAAAPEIKKWLEKQTKTLCAEREKPVLEKGLEYF